MKVIFMAVYSLTFIFFIDANPQYRDQLNMKEIAAFASDVLLIGQNRTSHIQTECLCVPYYRCDPGHWETTEHDHCTRFMYICCYGSEAVEYHHQ